MKKVEIHPKLLIAYSEVTDGNMDHKFGDKRITNKFRKTFFEKLDIHATEVIEAEQIHSSRILPLNEENSKMWKGVKVTGVDGFITTQLEYPLMIRVADCVPLVIYDQEKHALALIHAGWKGSTAGIHLKALEMLLKHHESNPENLIAWIGPSAKGCCYVSKDMPEQTDTDSWKDFIKSENDMYKVDLPGYLKKSLIDAGIPKKNITIDESCTVTSDTLYSHQRSESDKSPEGRIAVVAKLL